MNSPLPTANGAELNPRRPPNGAVPPAGVSRKAWQPAGGPFEERGTTMTRMTRQQQTAFRAPCFEAEETLDRRFNRLAIVEGHAFSVTLTLNTGLE